MQTGQNIHLVSVINSSQSTVRVWIDKDSKEPDLTYVFAREECLETAFVSHYSQCDYRVAQPVQRIYDSVGMIGYESAKGKRKLNSVSFLAPLHG